MLLGSQRPFTDLVFFADATFGVECETKGTAGRSGGTTAKDVARIPTLAKQVAHRAKRDDQKGAVPRCIAASADIRNLTSGHALWIRHSARISKSASL